jgi:hypothetical protein
MPSPFAKTLLLASLASGAGAYAGGRWWLAPAPAAPSAATRPAVDPEPQVRPAATVPVTVARDLAASRPATAPVPGARPIVLPRMGSFDLQLLQGRQDLGLFRTRARSYFMERAMECRHFHGAGDSAFEASLALSLENGELRIRGVDSIEVRRGSPLNSETLACLRAPYEQPVVLPPPGPPADAPAEYRAQFDGKWRGFPDFAGDVMVEAGFGDMACQPGQ